MFRMPAVHVRDVSEATLASLRERARLRGVSMQAELRRILDEAAIAPMERVPLPPLRLVTSRTGSDSTWRREDEYGDAGR